MNIVTGYGGRPHITANDAGSFNQGIFSAKDGVLTVGRKFEYSLISNNELRIYDGEGIMQGVHYRILPGTYESVVLENGTQGNKRIDLIVARYEKNAETGIESVEVAVKKGAETTEIPVEPTAMIGDIRKGATLHEMPLYSVEYNGITVKEIVSRFTEIADLRMVREEIDRLNSNFVSGNLGSFRITHQLVSLTYASATELAGFMYCGADVAAATATIIYQNSTPIDQVDRLYIDIGPYNTPSRINIHAHGTGFISGHILKVAVIVITTPA